MKKGKGSRKGAGGALKTLYRECKGRALNDIEFGGPPQLSDRLAALEGGSEKGGRNWGEKES